MVDLLRQYISDTDDHLQWTSGRAPSHNIEHFSSQRKDVVRILVHDPADFGGLNTASRPQQQFLTEIFLEASNLCTDCGRSQSQLFTGTPDTARTNHGPKVEKMMVVNPFHGYLSIGIV